jgi:phenylalanyl-tRNA synthetase beta chain
VTAVKGPFTYEALKPEEIEFIPLNQTKKMNAKELMEFYEVLASGVDREDCS